LRSSFHPTIWRR